MKKYFGLFLLFLPMVSLGAPSVRVLGNQPALTAAINSGAKLTPVKASNENSGSAAARVGTLSAKPKVSNLSSANSINSSSRFPVIQPAHSYSSVSSPQTGGASSGGSASYAPSNVNVAEIIDAVTEHIENNYYDTAHVYNNNKFVTAVRNVINDNEKDDPRFDAIRISNGNPRTYWESKGLSLPDDSTNKYVYIWIEENN